MNEELKLALEHGHAELEVTFFEYRRDHPQRSRGQLLKNKHVHIAFQYRSDCSQRFGETPLKQKFF